MKGEEERGKPVGIKMCVGEFLFLLGSIICELAGHLKIIFAK